MVELQVTAPSPTHSGKRLRCLLITPEKKVLEVETDEVIFPATDGLMGVLPGHVPMVLRLGSGLVRLHDDRATHQYVIDGGFAQIKENVVTLLTNRALLRDQIQPAQEQARLAEAQAMKPTTDEEFQRRDQMLASARAHLRHANPS